MLRHGGHFEPPTGGFEVGGVDQETEDVVEFMGEELGKALGGVLSHRHGDRGGDQPFLRSHRQLLRLWPCAG
jgi:hypothetical protein